MIRSDCIQGGMQEVIAGKGGRAQVLGVPFIDYPFAHLSGKEINT